MGVNIRLIYLYLFSFVGLLVVVIGSVQLVNLGMKVLIFPESDRYDYAVPIMEADEKSKIDATQMAEQAKKDQRRNRQRDLSNSLAMIAVGLPLYIYHWKTIQRENKK